MITYDSEIRPTDAEQLHTLLSQTYWANNRSLATVKASIQASLVVFARDEDGHLIGSARAVTDGVTFSWICDVVVDPNHRGQGVGKELVSRLLDDKRIKGTRKILVTKDAQGLYAQFGFRKHLYECMICHEETLQYADPADGLAHPTQL
jgi:predicted N-acetyltransferase YhbS